MINDRAGDRVEIEGRQFVRTQPGLVGHAIYGPYETVEPGKYRVEFCIRPLAEHADGRDALCALVDIVAGVEARLADALAFRSLIGPDGRFVVEFETDRRLEAVEYRVFVNGVEPLLVGDAPSVTKVARVGPPPRRPSLPRFFVEQLGAMGQLFTSGVGLGILADDVVATARDFSFYVRTEDDTNFINEVIISNTYNIKPPGPVCVIDVGLNIGLTSLRLATSERVREVHAFEPFPGTFARACANLTLNPRLQEKIRMYNFGLFDADRSVTTRIVSSDSGSYSVFGPETGEAVEIELRDAGRTLRPIVEAARAKNLIVVVKIDCEGSEYSVFRSLAAAGLFDQVAAFMVEYHSGWGSSSDLTAPLAEAGFVIIDLGTPGRNGFFYAVRLESELRRGVQPGL